MVRERVYNLSRYPHPAPFRLPREHRHTRTSLFAVCCSISLAENDIATLVLHAVELFLDEVIDAPNWAPSVLAEWPSPRQPVVMVILMVALKPGTARVEWYPTTPC